VKIYLVMIDDHHTDTEAHPFRTPNAAIDYARDYLNGCSGEVEELDPPDGWIFHAEYGTEGDGVWVIETGLDKDH
jgi:hypothetical protein